MSDLFVPYTEGDRYLSREKMALNELFGMVVGEFLTYMVTRERRQEVHQTDNLLHSNSAKRILRVISPCLPGR